MEYKPFTTLILIVLVVTFCSGYLLKIFEGSSYTEADGRIDFRDLQNCFWFVLVTMTTVGYGDFYPSTLIGRIITIFSSFVGIVLVSIIILNLQKKFFLTGQEFTVEI